MRPRPASLCLLLAAIAAAPDVRASLESDLYATWQRLHAERGYAWKGLDRESFSNTSSDLAHAEVHGRLLANGDAVLEIYTTPVDTLLVVRRGARGVARTLEGWKDRSEMAERMRLARTPGDLAARKDVNFALMALTAALPDAEILEFIKDATSLRAEGNEIVGELSPERADAATHGSTLALNTRGLIARGTVRFRVEGGRLTQYSVIADSTRPLAPVSADLPPDEPRLATRTMSFHIDRVTLIDYAPTGAVPEIPAAALARLAEKPPARRP